MSECAHSDDVTEVADTHDVMTCRKYGWTVGESFYAGKQSVELRQRHSAEVAVASTDDSDEHPPHCRYRPSSRVSRVVIIAASLRLDEELLVCQVVNSDVHVEHVML